MRTVHLIGVNHEYQLGVDRGPMLRANATPQDFAEFRDFLRIVIARHGIRGIAEEMSLSALRARDIPGDSVPCCLAKEIGLPHRYCDPDADTQAARGGMSDEQREQYWIKELNTFDTSPVLFIVGADHSESFKRLLIESGFQPFVVESNWQPSSTPSPTHAYEVRPRKDKRGVDLISDALPFGRLWYGEPDAISNAIGYAKFYSRSHDAVIRVYDEADNVIETHEQTGDFKEP